MKELLSRSTRHEIWIMRLLTNACNCSKVAPKSDERQAKDSMQLNLSEPATRNVQRAAWQGQQRQQTAATGHRMAVLGGGRWVRTGDGQWNGFVSAQVPDFYRLAAGQRRFNLCQIRIASSCPTTQPHNACSQATAPEAAQFQLHIKWRLATLSRILRGEPQTWLGLIIESKLLPLCVATWEFCLNSFAVP